MGVRVTVDWYVDDFVDAETNKTQYETFEYPEADSWKVIFPMAPASSTRYVDVIADQGTSDERTVACLLHFVRIEAYTEEEYED